MRPLIILLTAIFILAFGGVLLWKNQSGADYLLGEYQKIAPFSSREMTYHSIGKTLSGDGLIFYKPQFPNLPLRFKADRLQMRATPLEIHLHFSGMTLDSAQTLLTRDGLSLADTLKGFIPPDSFALQPLEGLVLLNRDVLKGTLDLNLRFEGKQVRATFIFSEKGKEVLRLSTIIHDANRGLWRWIQGSFQRVQLQISDISLCREMANYYRATGRPLPSELRQALETGSSFQSLISLEFPMPVLTLIKRF
ncbi:MAG: hypothetical protein SPL08_02615 [Pseudomonadota bacterium]|nr:hypothetical protein [Pseudomonadota bacterium]